MTRNLGIEGYLVLSILASAPNREWYGHELAKSVGASHGLVSRLLERFRDQGWVVDRWENSTSSAVGRQPRHYYQLHSAALPEVERVLKEVGRRVGPLARWASPSPTPTATVTSLPGPSALSTEEIAASIASYVAELCRRAAWTVREPSKTEGSHCRAANDLVPEPRVG